MATLIGYNNGHAIAYPSKLLAQNGGKHIYNVRLGSDCDNGNLVARGAWIDLDSYVEAAVTDFEGVIRAKAPNGNYYVEVVDPGDALFVYNQPFIEEEWTNTFKDESRWFNAQGDYVRAYELAVGDIFEVSAAGFSTTPTAASIGKSVSVANKKLVIGN